MKRLKVIFHYEAAPKMQKNVCKGKRFNDGRHDFCRVFSKKSHSYCSFVHQSALSPQFRAPHFRQMLSNPYKNINKSVRNTRGVQKRAPLRKRYKPAVKVAVASTLCTRVRARVLFLNRFQRKRFSCEHVSKLSRFSGELLNLSGVLQCIFKTLQKRSDTLKSAFRSIQFRL